MANKFFRDISQPKTQSKKGYKVQGGSTSCSECSKKIDPSQDFFELTCYWKIKNAPDKKQFCSLVCLNKWTSDEED